MGRLLMREEKRHFIIHPIGTSIGAHSHMSCINQYMNQHSKEKEQRKERVQGEYRGPKAEEQIWEDSD